MECTVHSAQCAVGSTQWQYAVHSAQTGTCCHSGLRRDDEGRLTDGNGQSTGLKVDRGSCIAIPV